MDVGPGWASVREGRLEVVVVQKLWTTGDDEILRELHGQGLPLNQIAKSGKLAWSRATIANHSKKLGLSYDRSAMERAVEASRIDRKAMRQVRLDRLAQIQDLVTKRIHDGLQGGGYHTLIGTGGGAEAEATLKHIPPQDLKAEAAALSALATTEKNTEAIDGDSSLLDAKSAMATFMEGIVAVAKQQGPVQ
jgi:hypothetical protein